MRKKYDMFHDIPENIRLRLAAFSSPERREAWINKPVAALGGRSILETLNSEEGEKKLDEYLLKIEGHFGGR